MAILNVARMGKFSSDRTIKQQCHGNLACEGLSHLPEVICTLFLKYKPRHSAGLLSL